LDRIDLLRIFVRVVESASFTKAAETLGLPRSSVSTAVQTLEARVGASLLHRTTRQVSPTQDGMTFFERSQRLLADYDEAESLFRDASSKPHGLLRINVPSRIGHSIIAPALPGFFSDYPDISLELRSTDRLVDPIQAGIDCVIRVGPLSDSSLISRKIGDLALVNCAAPAYLDRHGTPQTIEDLSRHQIITYLSPLSGRPEEWEWVDNGRSHGVQTPTRISVDDAEALIACCLAGLGLIQIPFYDVEDYLKAGRLATFMPDRTAAPMPISLLHPHRRPLSRRLQVFIDWVSALLLAKTRLQ